MIHSMTGFGKAVSDNKLVVEIRTLNSKQLDLNIRVCRFYREFESEIRLLSSKAIERGKADISIFFENNGAESNRIINHELFKKYYDEIKMLGNKVGNEEKTDYFSLALQMPDVLSTSSEGVSEQDKNLLMNTLSQALEQMKIFRVQEGKILAEDIESRVKRIMQLLLEAEPFEQQRIQTIKERLSRNLDAFINKELVDNIRFEQELFYYLEKLDITEEKVRLQKHCNYFFDTIRNEENTGRKLGFIAQEIGREINTLGSKSNNAEIQKIVVMMKDELEKIKEQLLNIL